MRGGGEREEARGHWEDLPESWQIGEDVLSDLMKMLSAQQLRQIQWFFREEWEREKHRDGDRKMRIGRGVGQRVQIRIRTIYMLTESCKKINSQKL